MVGGLATDLVLRSGQREHTLEVGGVVHESGVVQHAVHRRVVASVERARHHHRRVRYGRPVLDSLR